MLIPLVLMIVEHDAFVSQTTHWMQEIDKIEDERIS